MQPEWEGVTAVDVALDDRLPDVVEVLGELRKDRRVVERNRGRQNQKVPILTLPEGVDDGCHQFQYSAGSLEPLQGRPVVEQSIEKLWMDRVAVPKTVEVHLLLRLRRKAALMLGIEFSETLHDVVTALR